MSDYKMKPYDRLQSIFANDKELTDKASKRLDELLSDKVDSSDKVNKSFIDIILSFFHKIDSFIFRKHSRTNNTTYYKRK